MKAKFKEFQFVEVDGTATGYGDLIGWIKSVELSEILGQPYYHIRVYSGIAETVYVAEKFVRETERSINIEQTANGVSQGPMRENDSVKQLLSFAKYVAGLQLGCAPSVGFMEDIILKARKAVEISEKDINKA